MAARRQAMRGRSSRPNGTWARALVTATIGSGVKSLVTTFSLGNPGIDETIRRTRGRISVHSTFAPASGEAVVGMMVATDVAIGQGVASLPGPLTERSDDLWFVWEPMLFASGAASDNIQVITFDSKAMRKVEEGSGIAVVFESASGGNTLIVSVAISLFATRR